jgi:hypothetical protein
MKSTALCLTLLMAFFVGEPGIAADPIVVDVWPGAPADDNAETIGEEKVIQLIVKGKPYEDAGKPTK